MTQIKPQPNSHSHKTAEIRPALLPELAHRPWAIEGAKPIRLINCKIVDAAKGEILGDKSSVLIENGLITALDGASASTSDAAGDSVETYDLGGKFVCPGLIDAHVHIAAVPGVSGLAELLMTDEQVLSYRQIYVLRRMLERGFTTVRDTGGATKHTSVAIEEGLLTGPRLFQCGRALSQTGGHGDMFPGRSGGGGGPMCCGGHSGPLARVADGVPAVLRAVREELKAGADFIKIMLGGGVASETDAIDTVQYTAEEVRAITSSAHQMGKKMCTAHAYTSEAIRHAVENGVMGIEHGNLIDKATAEYMAEKGIYLTPTLSCYGAMVRPPFDQFLSPSSRVKNAEVMAQGLRALQLAEDAGVAVCYGSDMLATLHAFQTEEFSVRSQVLPAATILKHATINPARMLGYEGKLGLVAPGAFADLVVLDRNPLEDITVLDRPELYLKAVIKEGRVISGRL